MSVDREYRIRISTVTEGDPGKTAEGLKEVGKESEKALLSHREMHKILHLIAHTAGPEAGVALGGVATAAIGGFGIAILTVKELIEFIKKLGEEAAEVQKKISEGAIEMRNSIEESAKSWNEFVERAHEAEDIAKNMEGDYKRQKEIIDNVAEAHKKVLEAMEQEELAGAKGDKGKEDEIRARFAGLRQANDAAGAQMQIQERQAYIDRLKARQPDLNFAASLAAGDISYLKANKPVPAGFKIDEDVENKLRTEQRLASARSERAENGQETFLERLSGKSVTDRRQELAAAQKSLDEYLRNRDALTRYNDQLEREGKILTANEAARDHNKEAIKTETEALTGQKDKLAGQFSGSAVSKAIELSQRAAGGGSLNPTESSFVKQMGSLVSGQDLNLANAERVFQIAANNPAAMDRILARIAGLIDGQNKTLETWITRTEQKMTELQARIDRPRQ